MTFCLLLLYGLGIHTSQQLRSQLSQPGARQLGVQGVRPHPHFLSWGCAAPPLLDPVYALSMCYRTPTFCHRTPTFVTAPPLFVTAPPLLLPHPHFFVRTPKLATVFCVSGVGFGGNGWGFCGAGRQWRWTNFDLHPPPGREFCTDLLLAEAGWKRVNFRFAPSPPVASSARSCFSLKLGGKSQHPQF